MSHIPPDFWKGHGGRDVPPPTRERDAYALMANALLARLGGEVTLTPVELKTAAGTAVTFNQMPDGSLLLSIKE